MFYLLFIVAQFMDFDLDNSGDIGMIRHDLFPGVIFTCIYVT